MKQVLKGLKRGQRIAVSIVEIQDNHDLLVAYKGHLFRVRNASGKRFNVADSVLLVVSVESPLEFSIAGEQRLFSRVI